MNHKQALLYARTYLTFLVGLVLGLAIVYKLEHWEAAGQTATPTGVALLPDPNPLPSGQLSGDDRESAVIAWKYFQNNTDPQTGLTNSVEKYPYCTLWDSGSSLLAMLAAHRLGVVSDKEFHSRMHLALSSLAALPVLPAHLPNKSYSTKSLAMADYNGNPTEKGIGWSALDIGRLAGPLLEIALNYPEHALQVQNLLTAWNLQRLVHGGELMGGIRDGLGEMREMQEGRTGYEQYAATNLASLNVVANDAEAFKPHLQFTSVTGVPVPGDNRDPQKYKAIVAVVSEPYILSGLERGWNGYERELALDVYRAQESRYRKTGILTARTEDHLDRAPYFVYCTVLGDGRPWATITDKGQDASAVATVSTKAVFGWDALLTTEYTRKLKGSVMDLKDTNRGWYAGRYERNGQPNRALTANTNAVVLESIAYRVLGPSARLYRRKNAERESTR